MSDDWEKYEPAIQAFSDEMERQRQQHGWPSHPKPPVPEWQEDEKKAVALCLLAAMEQMPLSPQATLSGGAPPDLKVAAMDLLRRLRLSPGTANLELRILEDALLAARRPVAP